jgi:hypothetical protein
MSVVQTRGGIARVRRETIVTAGRKIGLPFFTSFIVARNKGANVIRMYFLEADFDANANYVELPVAAATDPHGEWMGPVAADNLWFRGVTASGDLELTVFQRRA